MSELTAFDITVAEEGYCEGFVKYRRSVYDKSEADKVIAELKAQKAQAETDCAYWKMRKANAANAMHETEEACMYLTKSEHRQKYKRCLAMARWCRASARFDESLGAFKYRDWYWKWFKRWLKIAEQFKETEAK